jgi:hypothetical protein
MYASDGVVLESAAVVLGGCCKTCSILPAFFSELLTVPDFASDVTFFAASAFGAVLATGLTADFAAVFGAALVVDFTADLTAERAGFGAFPAGRAAFVLVGVTTVFADVLVALLAAAPFVADLVTVAFMVTSFPMNCPASRDSA